MKAIIQTRYGSPDVLQLAEVEIPAPDDKEVLIKVQAASVNPVDWHLMRADHSLMRLLTGLLKPKNPTLGANFAGYVEAVGRDVTQFKVGDSVFGSNGIKCGGFAEYVCASETSLTSKPSNSTFEEAAAVPTAALTALQALRDEGKLQKGQKVLINGASGGVGTYAVQIAKTLGAEVTGVCSTKNLDLVRSIGADYVIDYTKEDFTQTGKRYDLLIDNVGDPSTYERFYKQSLTPNGICVIVAGAFFLDLIKGPWMTKTGNNKIGGFTAKSSKQSDLLFMGDLLQTDEVRSVIDRCYPLSETADAIRYAEKGHARGKVIIQINPS